MARRAAKAAFLVAAAAGAPVAAVLAFAHINIKRWPLLAFAIIVALAAHAALR